MISRSFLLVVILGSPNLAEDLIRLWRGDYSASFPIVPTLAIFMAGGLICVALLVLLIAFVQPQRPADE